MKTITLTFNEALVLIAEGMTMNNVKSLANKLRNADLPQPVIHPSNADLQVARNDVERAKAQSKTWEQSYHDAMANLDKAKQTEITLRDSNLKLSQRTDRLESKLRDLENDARQDDESLKYFRKWVEELRVVLECDKGLTTAAVFSQAVSYVKEYKTTAELLKKTKGQLEKANDVISTVKTAYDHEGWTQHKVVCEIVDTVEAYYRGN